MARFWIATFELPEVPPDDEAAAAPILAAGAGKLAIEVLSDDDETQFAVLFSKIVLGTLDMPEELKCLIGFTNATKACNLWHDRGFPLIDATIEWDPTKGRIAVISPHFVTGELAMQYETQLFAATGVKLKPKEGSATVEVTTRYQQALQSPDGAQPDILVAQRAVDWDLKRTVGYALGSPEILLEVANTRSPSLSPLPDTTLKVKQAWQGTASVPPRKNDQELASGKLLGRVKRADTFGVPAYRFEDVEILGFRIDLGAGVDDALDELIRPLNFHLPEAGQDLGRVAIPDFRYRTATRTLVIELLRYGKMKLKNPLHPIKREDFQSQHEMMARLLVGKVDDDTSQARAPAVYVPAIFVDNPWSKTLGRDVQGFDKRMADFCVLHNNRYERLLPDGRLNGFAEPDSNRRPRPLRDISQIRLATAKRQPGKQRASQAEPATVTGSQLEVSQAGIAFGAQDERPLLLTLDYSLVDEDQWEAFDNVDLDLALGVSSLSGVGWRQGDFENAEFRRSFARSAVADSLKGFRSVQVSPVGKRGMSSAWITGAFRLDDNVRIARPIGVATLTLHAVPENAGDRSAPHAPNAWNDLCRILGNGTRAEINLPTGSWYRLTCSMELTIDDGLD